MCICSDTRGFSSVCPRLSAWAEERTVSLQEKQARGDAVVILCAYLLAHVRGYDIIEGNMQTREQWGAVIYIVMLYNDSRQTPTESLLCAISLAVFTPSW